MSANTPEKDLAPVPVDPWILADVAYARYHDPHEVCLLYTSDAADE